MLYISTLFTINPYVLVDVLILFLTLQCEKEFHVGCLKDNGIEDLKVPQSSFFFFLNCEQ